jgi:hypothetical protein
MEGGRRLGPLRRTNPFEKTKRTALVSKLIERQLTALLPVYILFIACENLLRRDTDDRRARLTIDKAKAPVMGTGTGTVNRRFLLLFLSWESGLCF